jgi:hypothetical protein
MRKRESSWSEEFGKLADAVRGRSDPLRPTTLSRIALKRLEPHSDSSLAVLTAPVTPVHILTDRPKAPVDRRPRRLPPPLPTRRSEPPLAPSSARALAVLRAGAEPAKGLSGSSLLFLVVIALVVLTMSVVGLALLVPTSQWALLQG